MRWTAFAVIALGTLIASACAPAAEAPTGSSATPTGTAVESTARSATPGVAEGQTAARVVRVIDGDTIAVEIDGEEYTVRYIGIDTPETVHPQLPVQCFGIEASARNKELVEGETVGLEKDVSETDRYGRLLRYVWAGGQMVNALLVQEGYAQASTYPPDVKYQDLFLGLQEGARTAAAGLWGDVCASPTRSPTVGGGPCEYSGTAEPVIKGNINSEGERIYHVPGGSFYESTVIDESQGERWFCTESEAIDAGWRKSQA